MPLLIVQTLFLLFKPARSSLSLLNNCCTLSCLMTSFLEHDNQSCKQYSTFDLTNVVYLDDPVLSSLTGEDKCSKHLLHHLNHLDNHLHGTTYLNLYSTILSSPHHLLCRFCPLGPINLNFTLGPQIYPDKLNFLNLFPFNPSSQTYPLIHP